MLIVFPDPLTREASARGSVRAWTRATQFPGDFVKLWPVLR
jgi:hypothetical protein